MSSLLQMTWEMHESELNSQHNFTDNCCKIMVMQQCRGPNPTPAPAFPDSSALAAVGGVPQQAELTSTQEVDKGEFPGPRSWSPMLCQFPVAVITNGHKQSGSEQHNFLTLQFRSSEVENGSAGLCSFWRLQEEGVSLPFSGGFLPSLVKYFIINHLKKLAVYF